MNASEQSVNESIACKGWWEQQVYGRQPMTSLQVLFQDKRLIGRGIDIVGKFELDGTLHSNGQVVIVKQYVGRHKVLYVGTYDGEGTFSGHWQIGNDHGRWLISMNHRANPKDSENSIEEIIPPAGV